jgi:hypothetical protein
MSPGAVTARQRPASPAASAVALTATLALAAVVLAQKLLPIHRTKETDT